MKCQDNVGVKERFQGQGKDVGNVGVGVMNEGK